VVYIDAKASAAQAKALAAALSDRYGQALGSVAAVKRAPITFRHDGTGFRVDAKGIGRMSVDALPDHACCTQPHLVWYQPLVPLTDRRVGYTRESGVHDATLDTEWSKEGQNTAFYGAFAS
jgi:hypothetical protein